MIDLIEEKLNLPNEVKVGPPGSDMRPFSVVFAKNQDLRGPF